MHVYIVLCIISYIHVCCRVYRKMAMSEIDILVIILIYIQNYTCINYTVFFRFLSSELTYDNYCTCHSLINCIYQDILLLSIFFSVTSRAIVIFYYRFRSSNNCYYFFLCNVVCYIVIFSLRFCPVSPTHYYNYTYTSVIYSLMFQVVKSLASYCIC